MSDLNDIRANAHSATSEAERIYFDEGSRELFLAIQTLRAERDQAILDAIAKVTQEYDGKIREAEAHHGFILVLSKGA